MKRILVTGAGALLGQGILRSIGYTNKPYYVVSADPDVRSTGHAIAHKWYVIPFANEASCWERIEKIVFKERFNIIPNKIERSTNICFDVVNEGVISRSFCEKMDPVSNLEIRQYSRHV